MPLLDVQRRGQQIGRLRIGQKVKFMKDGVEKERPARLDTFRFTTGSEVHAQAIAQLYGGTVQPWGSEFEVITDKSAIAVTVPPRDEVVTQWYEMWTGGGAARRCDSQAEQISGQPCLCAALLERFESPQDKALERSRLAAMNPPRACKPVTRINVMIPDLPGLGVFRLDTHSYYAAVEIGDTARLMQMAQEQGVFLPAQLRIEQRSRVAGGQTKKYPVPVLEVLATFRDLTSGALEAGGYAAQLPPPPGQPLAITSGTAASQGEAAPAARGPRPEKEEGPPTAQQIADLAPKAKEREDVEKLQDRAKDLGLLGDEVWVSVDGGAEMGETLRETLRRRWKELPAPARQRRQHAEREEAHAAPPQPPSPATSPAGDSGGDSLFDDDPEWEGR